MTWPLSRQVELTLNEVEGLIPPEVGLYLAHQASKVEAPNWIVNIGIYKGKSIGYLCAGAAAGVPVYGIDPWDLPDNASGRFGYAEMTTREAAFENIRKMQEVGVIRGDLKPGDHLVIEQNFSTKVAVRWDNPVGLIFIDGDHRYQSVLDDCLAWAPYVIPGGMMILDDWGTAKNPGVERAADRFVRLFDIPYRVEVERLAVFEIPETVNGF